MLNHEQLTSLIDNVQDYIAERIIVANRIDGLDTFLKAIGYLKEEYVYCEPRTSRVLVLGATAVGMNVLRQVIKDLGLDVNRFEFITDYNDCKRYRMDSLRGNTRYSDLLLGPMPHSTTRMGDCSSIIAKIQNNQSDYPKAYVMRVNGAPKITKESFREALLQTRYMEFLEE